MQKEGREHVSVCAAHVHADREPLQSCCRGALQETARCAVLNSGDGLAHSRLVGLIIVRLLLEKGICFLLVEGRGFRDGVLRLGNVGVVLSKWDLNQIESDSDSQVLEGIQGLESESD